MNSLISAKLTLKNVIFFILVIFSTFQAIKITSDYRAKAQFEKEEQKRKHALDQFIKGERQALKKLWASQKTTKEEQQQEKEQ